MASTMVYWKPFLWLFLLEYTTAQELSPPERRYACWGSFGPPVVSAQCPRDTVIQITRAGLKVQSHGSVCSYSDSDCGCNYGEAGCNMPDVRNLCMGRPACRLDVTQQYINTETCRGFSDYMFVEFHCVPVQQNSIKDICSKTVDSSESGFIRSPTDAGAPHGGRTCDCTLVTSPYSTLALTVLDFHTNDQTCERNKLTVNSNGQDNTYCGDRGNIESEITPDTNKVTLTFDTDGSEGSGGFWLKYEARPSSSVDINCKVRAKPPALVEETTTMTTTKRLMSTSDSQSTVQSMKSAVPQKPTTQAPAQLDKDQTRRRTPWWWRFTLRTRISQTTRTTTEFPPWFEEVDATELPEWIEKKIELASKLSTQSTILPSMVSTLPPTKIAPPLLVTDAPANVQLNFDSKAQPEDNLLSTQPENKVLSKPKESSSQQSSIVRSSGNHINSPKIPKAPAVLPYPSQNAPHHRGEDMTVTVTAACVIGSILLIVIIGIVVRFVINRADTNHALRQRHKKECVLRRNTHLQRSAKSYA